MVTDLRKQAVKVVTSPNFDWLPCSTNQIDSDYYLLLVKYTISWRCCLFIVLILSLSYLSVFIKSHVASFQGRVACHFYPLEGLFNNYGPPLGLSHLNASRTLGFHSQPYQTISQESTAP